MAQSHYELIRNAKIPSDFKLASAITNLFVMALAALQSFYFKASKSATCFIRSPLPHSALFLFRTLGAAAGSELAAPQAIAKRYNGYPRIPALDEVTHTTRPMCRSVIKAAGLTAAATITYSSGNINVRTSSPTDVQESVNRSDSGL